MDGSDEEEDSLLPRRTERRDRSPEPYEEPDQGAPTGIRRCIPFLIGFAFAFALAMAHRRSTAVTKRTTIIYVERDYDEPYLPETPPPTDPQSPLKRILKSTKSTRAPSPPPTPVPTPAPPPVVHSGGRVVDLILTASTIPTNINGQQNTGHKPYPMNEWCNFFASLRDTGFAGDVIMGTAPELISHADYAKFKEMGPFNLTMHTIDHVLEDDATNRFIFYKKMLADKRYDHGLVFMLDFHDVFFQSNPFPLLRKELGSSSQLATFAEAGIANLETQVTNKQWMESCFNSPERRKRWAGKPILNSGSTGGTAKGVRRYLEKFTEHVSGGVDGCLTNDQGHHNWLVYSGEIDDLNPKTWPQGNGAINVIGLFPNVNDVSRDSEGFVVQQDKSRSPIVHQYNRFREVVDWANSHWGNDAKCRLNYKDVSNAVDRRKQYLQFVREREAKL